MQDTINKNLVASLRPRKNPYEIRDNRLKGFILRIQPSGSMSYICEYGRGKRITIGKAALLSPAEARDEAKDILEDVRKGRDPREKRNKSIVNTLQEFLDDIYEPWLRANSSRPDEEIIRLKAKFKDLYEKPIGDLTAWHLEKWKASRIRAGIKPTTVNRDIAPLKAAMSRAVQWDFIKENPFVSVKLCKTDSNLIVRYLTNREEKRLRQELNNRERRIRKSRKSANKWRKERNRRLFNDFSKVRYVDHLQPMILISINTGLRRGELFQLKWSDINLSEKFITVRGTNSKSKKTRHVPLNSEALDVITSWYAQKSKRSELVFPSADGDAFTNVIKAWKTLLSRAGIKDFRWHDMRHTFATNLVMAGVDLNTVRELLGHSDLTMTLRYAHLAPEHKAEAVNRLSAS